MNFTESMRAAIAPTANATMSAGTAALGAEQPHAAEPETAPRPLAEAALVKLGQALQALDYRFVTVTPATHARVNARPENAVARCLTDVFGWSRPFSDELVAPPMLASMRAADVVEPCRSAEGGYATALLQSRVRASTLGELLFFHSAWPTLDPAAIFFGPDSYRFVAAVQRWLAAAPVPPRRAVDVGCGAGPGAIAIARACPDAEVAAVDINERALAFCRVNAALAGVRNVQAVRSDLLAGVDGQFDLIVANPPYLLDPLERSYRHGGGRLGGGLSLAILDSALERLAPGGTLLLYTGSAIVDGRDLLHADIAERLVASGAHWRYEELDPDIFGEELETPAYAAADRIAAVLLTLTC